MKIKELTGDTNKVLISIIFRMWKWFNENDIKVEKTTFKSDTYTRITFTYIKFQSRNMQTIINGKIKELIQHLDTGESLNITTETPTLLEVRCALSLVIDSDGDALMFFLDRVNES